MLSSPGKDVLSQSQFSAASLESLYRVADALQANVKARKDVSFLKGQLLACVFMEPSTRTSCCFMAAIQRLGGTSILVNEQGSSAKKGETLEDTMRCLECYADALVLRHPVKGSAARAAAACAKPVLNAGDGVGEHPTQALLDVYTMRCELARALRRLARETASPSPDSVTAPTLTTASSANSANSATTATGSAMDGLGAATCGELLAGKAIVLLGDLKHGRTVHSLATLVARNYPGARLLFVSPPQLAMPQDIKDEVAACGCAFSEHQDLDEVVGAADVLYVTRVQKERFADPSAYEALKLRYVVTPATMAKGKASLVLLHPLPRVGEIDEACDSDPRAAYFRQMENGMYVRMALLMLVLGGDVSQLLPPSTTSASVALTTGKNDKAPPQQQQQQATAIQSAVVEAQ